MKPIFLLLTTCFIFSLSAQNKKIANAQYYPNKVTIVDATGKKIKGFYKGFNDTALLILPESKASLSTGLLNVSYTNLVDVQFIMKGSAGHKMLKTGLLTGFITLAGLTAIAATLKVPIFPKEDAPFFGPYILLLSAGASGVGAIIAGVKNEKYTHKLNYTVLGSKENFDSMKINVAKRMNH